MVVLALLLIAASVAVAVAVLLANTDATTLNVFGVEVNVTEAGLFLAGAASMLGLLVGLGLLRLGLARVRRRRAEVRDLKRERSDEVGRLEAERTRLAQEKANLERQLGQHGEAPTRPNASGSTAGGASATRPDSR